MSDQPSRMAYRVEYVIDDSSYAASMDTLRDVLLFAAVHLEADRGPVTRITGPDDLLLEGDELADAIANPPEPEPVPADDIELEEA